MTATDLPLVLLDVDGVLNALGMPDEAVHPDWRRGSAQALGRHWPIQYAPTVIDRIRSWIDDDRAQLAWLTTWGHDANAELRRLLGLPELPVAGTRDDTEPPNAGHGAPPTDRSLAGQLRGDPLAGQLRGDDTTSLAGATPSAPSPDGWWKADVVESLLAAWPARTLVWIDDELVADSRFTDWATSRGVLVIGPDPLTGLTVSDLDAVERALGGPVSDPAGR